MGSEVGRPLGLFGGMHLGTAQVVTHDRWDGHQESNSRINPGTQGLHLGVVAWNPGGWFCLSPLL